jgi:murein DD-endopeptidase MepM/ murein hydrolase activator NlpD
MDEERASQDALGKTEKIPTNEQPEVESPQPMGGWDRFWNRVVKLGMGDIAMRAGSALLTIGLIGLIIWVMKGFFLSGEMATSSTEPLEMAANTQAGGLPLPAYEGVAPVEGLSRSPVTHTNAPAGTRYDFQEYEVVTGDSIWTIAEKFGLDPATILWNNTKILYDNPALIYPGQKISIPPVNGVLYYWNEGDGLNGVAKGLNVTPEDILNWPGNQMNADTIGDYAHPNIAVGTAIFAPGGTKAFLDWTSTIFYRDEAAESKIWGEGKCEPAVNGPVGNGTYVWPSSEHRISGYEFTPEVNHWGIDIGGDTGNPIYATDNGVVVYAGWNAMGYGNVIAIDHGKNADGSAVQSIYAHLSAFNVSCGSFVYQGDIIGYMGSTGNSSGPHLHFELLVGSNRVNPHKYLGE